MLVERNSLRTVSRIKHCKADAAHHWLDLAGQQGAAVNRYFIRDLPPTQVQVNELWSFGNYSASYILIPREAALTAFLEKE